MKLASWNVNSLKVRMPHLLDWMARQLPDVVCLQETKVEDSKFPLDAIEQAGYRCVWSGQKTYNGVAILSKRPAADITTGIPGLVDEQKRVIAATLGDPGDELRIVCAYVPNGQAIGSDKYRYKLEWLAAFRNWLEDELRRYPRLAVLGDYNIAPVGRGRPRSKVLGGPGPVQPRRARGISRPPRPRIQGQFPDARPAREIVHLVGLPHERFQARNLGLRIDHMLLSPELASRCRALRDRRAPAPTRAALRSRAHHGGTGIRRRVIVESARQSPQKNPRRERWNS